MKLVLPEGLGRRIMVETANRKKTLDEFDSRHFCFSFRPTCELYFRILLNLLERPVQLEHRHAAHRSALERVIFPEAKSGGNFCCLIIAIPTCVPPPPVAFPAPPPPPPPMEHTNPALNARMAWMNRSSLIRLEEDDPPPPPPPPPPWPPPPPPPPPGKELVLDRTPDAAGIILNSFFLRKKDQTYFFLPGIAGIERTREE